MQETGTCPVWRRELLSAILRQAREERSMDVAPSAGNKQKRKQSLSTGRLPFRQFFATAPVPCPYLPGRAERKIIVALGGGESDAFYDNLSRIGFRRSHRFAYRPACGACAACVPVRIAVNASVIPARRGVCASQTGT